MSGGVADLFRNILRVQHAIHFPPKAKGRPAVITFDDAYDDILKVVRTGMQWRSLKPRNVSFVTVFKTMHKWVHADLFKTAYQKLLTLYSRQRRPRYCAIDSTFVKNMYGRDCIGRNPTDRGRKATKVSTVVDDRGVPFGLLFTPANHADVRLFDATLENLLVSIPTGTQMLADKGYDSANNRRVCEARGLKDRIFRRRTMSTRRTHARRGVVERFFSWLDKYRRIVLRYECGIAVYEAMTYLACGIILQKRIVR